MPGVDEGREYYLPPEVNRTTNGIKTERKKVKNAVDDIIVEKNRLIEEELWEKYGEEILKNIKIMSDIDHFGEDLSITRIKFILRSFITEINYLDRKSKDYNNRKSKLTLGAIGTFLNFLGIPRDSKESSEAISLIITILRNETRKNP